MRSLGFVLIASVLFILAGLTWLGRVAADPCFDTVAITTSPCLTLPDITACGDWGSLDCDEYGKDLAIYAGPWNCGAIPKSNTNCNGKTQGQPPEFVKDICWKQFYCKYNSSGGKCERDSTGYWDYGYSVVYETVNCE